MKAVSATATSPSAAPTCARSTSTSLTTRSSRSRSGWPMSIGTPSASWVACSSAAIQIDRRHHPQRCGAGDDRCVHLVLLLLANDRVGSVGDTQGVVEHDGRGGAALWDALPA